MLLLLRMRIQVWLSMSQIQNICTLSKQSSTSLLKNRKRRRVLTHPQAIWNQQSAMIFNEQWRKIKNYQIKKHSAYSKKLKKNLNSIISSLLRIKITNQILMKSKNALKDFMRIKLKLFSQERCKSIKICKNRLQIYQSQPRSH